MSTAQLIAKIERLPPKLKEEVEAFIATKERQASDATTEGSSGVKLGLLSHKKLWMSADFDAPLEDFRDYM